jgi:acyl dehydratase
MGHVLSQSRKPVDRYLEDFVVGERWSSDPVQVTADDIKEFAALYGPRPFHADEAEAKRCESGALVVSGWHLIALAMREFVRAKTLGNTPIIGMGADGIRWLKPVGPGAALTFHREISDIRRSASKPDRGVITTELRAVDQHGDIVMKMSVLTRVPSRIVAEAKDSQN